MTASHRKALFKNLANALFEHERIKTTNPKAMELRRVADRLISLAKKNDMHAMRLAFAFLRSKEMVKKLFTDIGPRYAEINGGYTRVLKAGRRKGDAAPMAIIELTQRKEKETEKKGEDKAKEKKAKAKEKKAKEAKPKEAKAKEKKAKEPEEKKEAKPKAKKAKAGKPEAAEKPKASKPRSKKSKEVEPEEPQA
ncbi:MAG: ribosomal protein L17p [Deltaproteobacteria bacterium]|jgi:large subunit ribosomal protein L17|nr:ribosomal protein L17p [Deltaproteobacteria bacterium]